MDSRIAKLHALKAVTDMVNVHSYEWIDGHGSRHLSPDEFYEVMEEVKQIAEGMRRERLELLDDMFTRGGYEIIAPGTTVYRRQEDAIKSSEVKGFYGGPVYLDEAIEEANDALLATIEKLRQEKVEPEPVQEAAPEPEQKPSTRKWHLVREYNRTEEPARRAAIETEIQTLGFRFLYNPDRDNFEATPIDRPLPANRLEKDDAAAYRAGTYPKSKSGRKPKAEPVQEEETEEVNGVEILSTNRFQLINAFNQSGTNLVARTAIVKALKKLGFKPVKKDGSKEYVLAEIDRDTPAPAVVLNNLRPDFIERRANIS